MDYSDFDEVKVKTSTCFMRINYYLHGNKPIKTMRKTLLPILFACIFNQTYAQNGCLTADNGQYPEYVYVPTCSNQIEYITEYGFSSEYSKVQLTAGVTYEFAGSIASDFITISNENGSSVIISGTDRVLYTPTENEIVRFYLHLNSNCNSNYDDLKIRSIKCSSAPTSYCEPILTCVDGANILNVTSRNFTNTTTCGTNGYNDFTNQSLIFTKNEPNLLAVQIGYGWVEQAVSMWIDYNNNYQFEENEFFLLGLGTNTVINSSLRIPAEVPEGNYRLRIRVAAVGETQASWDKACDSSQYYGETEDYTVSIVERLNTNDVAKRSVVLTPNPFKNELTIKRFDEVESLVISNTLGQIVYEGKAKEKLDTKHLNKGVYVVKIIYKDQRQEVVKLIKE